ncbi:MAG: TonB C-terminal domain-containing protein [Deltaproteobacteria bacterium]|nr:TonB C-terminal domain-containing protein [Deltaproteobacteria bacterium]
MMPLLGMSGDRYDGVSLGNMIVLSFLLHAVVLSIIIFSPPLPRSPISLGPVQVVDLVSITKTSSSTAKSVQLAPEIGKVVPRGPAEVIRKEVNRIPVVPIVPLKRSETPSPLGVDRAIRDLERRLSSPEATRAPRVEAPHREVRTPTTPTTPMTPMTPSTSSGTAGPAVASSMAGSSADAQSSGTGAAEGGEGGQANTQMQIYYAFIWSQIKEQWVLPKGILPNDDFEAVMAVKILRNGSLADFSFEKRSGNGYFDESVMKAVKKASPFPPLPEWHTGSSLEVGIRFRGSELQ